MFPTIGVTPAAQGPALEGQLCVCLRDADDEVLWLDLHAVPPAVRLCGMRPGVSQTGGCVPSAPWGPLGPVDPQLLAPPSPDPLTGAPPEPPLPPQGPRMT